MWIKLDDNLYAKEASNDPEEIINLIDLENEIKDLQTQIQNLENELLEYPAGADERMKQAIDDWNESNVRREQNMLFGELAEKQSLLNEIKNDN